MYLHHAAFIYININVQNFCWSKTMTRVCAEALGTGVWRVIVLELLSEVNCPWSSIVNLCCFDGCIFFSRSAGTEKTNYHSTVIQFKLSPALWSNSIPMCSTHIIFVSCLLRGEKCNTHHISLDITFLPAVHKVSILLQCIKMSAAHRHKQHSFMLFCLEEKHTFGDFYT